MEKYVRFDWQIDRVKVLDQQYAPWKAAFRRDHGVVDVFPDGARVEVLLDMVQREVKQFFMHHGPLVDAMTGRTPEVTVELITYQKCGNDGSGSAEGAVYRKVGPHGKAGVFEFCVSWKRRT